MKTISYIEAQRRFIEIIEEVHTKGISYSVFRHDKEIVRIIPPREVIDGNIDEFFEKYGEALAELAKR